MWNVASQEIAPEVNSSSYFPLPTHIQLDFQNYTAKSLFFSYSILHFWIANWFYINSSKQEAPSMSTKTTLLEGYSNSILQLCNYLFPPFYSTEN